MRRVPVAVAVLVVLIATAANAQKVYKWTDAQGQVQYTQTPPPDGVQSEQPKLADNEVTEQRRRYCGAIRSIAYSLALNSHQSISTVSEEVRQLEAREDLDVDQVALRELVNFVYAGARSGRAARYDGMRGNAGEIAGRAENACLSGSFGKRGRTAVAEADADNRASAKDPPKASTFTGTGWVTHGLVATNYHVIEGKDRIRVRFAGGREATAFVGATDPDNDVALLRVGGQLPPGLPLANDEAAIGADVFTLGYPHTQIMGNNAKLTTGIVSSTTGLRDDPRVYQISVPVQSGNSGGPLLNRRGEVVGLVTAKLSAARVYQGTGDLPQNVNYAVKVRYLQTLLTLGSGTDEDLPAGADSLENHAARIGPSVVLVIAE